MSKRMLAGWIALMLVAGWSCLAQSKEHTKNSLEKVKENLKAEKAILLDVRELDEWEQGHLEQAKLVPLSKLKEQKEEATKDLDKKIIVYTHCRAGRRAMTAGDILEELGFDVRPLKQGYEELLEAGFPKHKEKK